MNKSPDTTTPRSIFSPNVDLFTTGALSLLTAAIVLVVGPQFFIDANFAQLVVIATLVNGAHFAASYRMLYFNRREILRYPQASIRVPALLLGYCLWALYTAATLSYGGGVWIQALLVAVAYYLAVHYTGQTWGMMSSFAYVENLKFSTCERRLFRTALNFLMLWQILWATKLVPDQPSYVVAALPILDQVQEALIALAILLGICGFISISKRLGKLPPLRVTTPFAALLGWFALLNYIPGSLVIVQFFHALQYLIFPVRVEANRVNRIKGDSQARPTRHLLEYTASLLAVAAIVFLLVPNLIRSWGTGYEAYAIVFVSFINIHHFYIDGVIWKLGSQAVREDLFAHLAKS